MTLAPAPTTTEILKAIGDSGHLYSAGDIAARIYRARGGTGDLTNAWDRYNSPVRPVSADRVRQVLVEMIHEGVLDVAIGGTDDGALGRVFGHVRDNARYYGLAGPMAASREQLALRKHQQEAEAEQTVRLRERYRGRVLDILVRNDTVTITTTLEQARALCLFGDE